MESVFEIDSISTITGILTSVLALAVSVMVFLSEKNLTINSLKPLLNCLSGKSKTRVYVRLCNFGEGPAVIKNIVLIDNENRRIKSPDGERYRSLAHFLNARAKEQGIDLGTYSDFIPLDSLLDRAIPAGDPKECGNLYLVDYCSDDKEKIDFVRKTLSSVNVAVEYDDVFGNRQKQPCVSRMSWMEDEDTNCPMLCPQLAGQ